MLTRSQVLKILSTLPVGVLLAGNGVASRFSYPALLGEYLDASFTAKRHTYPEDRQLILVPGGPPLAT